MSGNADAAAAPFAGQRVTVMGLGRFSGGVGVARYLARQGAIVTVTDTADPPTLEASVAALADVSVRLVLGRHCPEDFTETDLVVVGPGVPKTSPYLAMARAAGVPLTAEMNLLLGACRGRVIGVTGSNGKSTTTAMIHAALEAGATAQALAVGGVGDGPVRPWRAWLGGNIGQSLLERVTEIAAADRVVLEVSSFQLEDLSDQVPNPAVAVVTNLTANHLDRHESMAEYAAAKQRIFARQGSRDWLVLNADDAPTAAWSGLRRGRLGWFSICEGRLPEGDVTVQVLGPHVTLRDRRSPGGGQGPERVWQGVMPLRLVGRHNQANAAAALTAAVIDGVDPATAAAAIAAFGGLPDRLEWVGCVGGVDYINDSIATTPESVLAALESYADRPRICIMGGVNKNLDFASLARVVQAQAKAVVLIGRAADELAALLTDKGLTDTAEIAPSAVGAQTRPARTGPVVVRARDMADAVRRAAALAAPGDVVLMSPACASFDMFVNYRHRGEVFTQAVKALANGA